MSLLRFSCSSGDNSLAITRSHGAGLSMNGIFPPARSMSTTSAHAETTFCLVTLMNVCDCQPLTASLSFHLYSLTPRNAALLEFHLFWRAVRFCFQLLYVVNTNSARSDVVPEVWMLVSPIKKPPNFVFFARKLDGFQAQGAAIVVPIPQRCDFVKHLFRARFPPRPPFHPVQRAQKSMHRRIFAQVWPTQRRLKPTQLLQQH